jgi:hypothetical protein
VQIVGRSHRIGRNARRAFLFELAGTRVRGSIPSSGVGRAGNGAANFTVLQIHFFALKSKQNIRKETGGSACFLIFFKVK